jgi:hypothetical protein
MSFLDQIFGASSLPSSPTGQVNTSSSIQPWAQPYVFNYLNRAQQLAQGTPQPTALQQQAYADASNMQVPGQFEQGTGFANQAGQGMLGTTGTALGYGAQGAGYGQQASGYGQQATGAGQAYQTMATDPSQIQKYMNPYIQQALNPQLAMLNQQQALAGQNLAAKATGQGAFGGNRAALSQGLNAQNYALSQQQAIGQGYSDAFKQAQQAQQFGADLGLRGLQTGIQGQQAAMQGTALGLQGVNAAQQGYAGANQAAATLGNLGSAKNAAQLGITGLRNQLGTQQYNLPYQNLQFLQGMMSGLPISSQSQQSFQAPPNYTSQLAGLGLTGAAAYSLFNKGGKVKSYAKGGSVKSGSDLANIRLNQLLGAA